MNLLISTYLVGVRMPLVVSAPVTALPGLVLAEAHHGPLPHCSTQPHRNRGVEAWPEVCDGQRMAAAGGSGSAPGFRAGMALAEG